MSVTADEPVTSDGSSELEAQIDKAEEPVKKPRKTTGERVDEYSLYAAPFLIALLALVIYFYYQSLDLENAIPQQKSTLAWDQNLKPQIFEHLQISFLATLLVIVIAIPLGILLTRPALRKYSPYIIAVANSGQALPAFGLLVIGITFFGTGMSTAVYMLAIYALLPVLRNTMVGLDAVDRNVIEAGRGMGFTKLQALTKIELPLSVPVIIAGIRTAMILNIGMVTIATYIAAGGLGDTIDAGLSLGQQPVLLVGAGVVAVIALAFDWIGAVAEKFLKPKGLT